MSETPPAPSGGHSGPLSGSVKLPGVGPVSKKVALGGVAVVGILALLWLRNRASSSSSTSTAGGVVDPATGYVYGTPEDTAALQNLTTYDPGYDTSGGGSSGSSSSSGSTGDQVDSGPPFTSNAAWTQYATNILGSVPNGPDPGAVASALGAYIAGDQVTAAQRDIINQAIAYAGLPPVAGTNGYPPSINVSGSVSGTGSAPGAPTLTAGGSSTSSVAASWAAVQGATGYGWHLTGAVDKSGTTSTPGVTVSGLAAGTSYTLTVYASNAYGNSVPASITLTTTAATVNPTPVPITVAPVPTGGNIHPASDRVTVVAYHTPNPAWNSTMWGIAKEYGYGSASTNYTPIWNDPLNAALRAKRGAPEHIQAGDVVNVSRK